MSGCYRLLTLCCRCCCCWCAHTQTLVHGALLIISRPLFLLCVFCLDGVVVEERRQRWIVPSLFFLMILPFFAMANGRSSACSASRPRTLSHLVRYHERPLLRLLLVAVLRSGCS